MRRQRQTDRQVGLSTASLSAIERLVREAVVSLELRAWICKPHLVLGRLEDGPLDFLALILGQRLEPPEEFFDEAHQP